MIPNDTVEPLRTDRPSFNVFFFYNIASVLIEVDVSVGDVKWKHRCKGLMFTSCSYCQNMGCLNFYKHCGKSMECTSLFVKIGIKIGVNYRQAKNDHEAVYVPDQNMFKLLQRCHFPYMMIDVSGSTVTKSLGMCHHHFICFRPSVTKSLRRGHLPVPDPSVIKDLQMCHLPCMMFFFITFRWYCFRPKHVQVIAEMSSSLHDVSDPSVIKSLQMCHHQLIVSDPCVFQGIVEVSTHSHDVVLAHSHDVVSDPSVIKA